MKKSLMLFLVSIIFVSCSVNNRQPRAQAETIVVETQDNAVPGTVTGVWQEPMVDTVRVPGQIDPQGTYYRAPHQTIIEVYPGRVQEVQYPPDERSEGKSKGGQ